MNNPNAPSIPDGDQAALKTPIPMSEDRPPYDIYAKSEKVTPEIAESWLQLNTYNRKKLDSHIERMARDVVDGKFKLTGEPIIFADNGRLMDGQNRLEAIVKGGKPVWILVVRNVPVSCFDCIGLGKPRTISDILQLSGAANPSLLAGALYYAIPLEKHKTAIVSAAKTPTVNEYEEFLSRNRSIIADVARVKDRGQLWVQKGLACALLFHFGKIDVSLSNQWLDAITVEGANQESLVSQEAFVLMRDGLTRVLGTQKKTLIPSKRAKVCIRAWNSIIQGVPLKREKLMLFVKNEEFPKICSPDGIPAEPEAA